MKYGDREDETVKERGVQEEVCQGQDPEVIGQGHDPGVESPGQDPEVAIGGGEDVEKVEAEVGQEVLQSHDVNVHRQNHLVKNVKKDRNQGLLNKMAPILQRDPPRERWALFLPTAPQKGKPVLNPLLLNQISDSHVISGNI